MNDFSLEELPAFIIKAKAATYVGKGQKLLPYRQGSHDLQYFDGDWAYHDSYLGDADFIGEEVVYHRGVPVWGENYYGRILQPERITAAEAGAMIQASLKRMYAEGRFLGGFRHVHGDLTYMDVSQGDVSFFTGREWIERGGEAVYELVYHGGLVR